ncbi:hypothetical protein [Salinigranum sp. GCM10025319]|uniref:hypothetical protein n=1 Tax=Salinigranum sp. GCM10025319 TaxID=3252687 RepID=UPI00361A89E7
MTLRKRSLGEVIHGEVANAVIGWALTTVVVVASVQRVAAGRLAWGLFWLFAVGTIALPAAVYRDWTVIVPWPLPFSAVAAIALRSADLHVDIAGYVAITAVALVVVVELDRFTRVDMSRRFTVGFAVLTTMAMQAVWTVIQFVSDRLLDTAFLSTQAELQWDIVYVTLVAVVMGAVFVSYLDRVAPSRSADRPFVPEESP